MLKTINRYATVGLIFAFGFLFGIFACIGIEYIPQMTHSSHKIHRNHLH